MANSSCDNLPLVLVTGANGQLGSEIGEYKGDKFNLLLTDQKELDITNASQLEEFVKRHKPAIILNCAAYTAVDRAEDEPELAMEINRNAVLNLANVAKEHNALLVHISTDYVFDGKGPLPYKEKETTNPASVYGYTKALGENEVLLSGAKYLIIRTSWLYSIYGDNFVKKIAHLSHERESLNVVFDQIGTPTWAADLASALIEICGGYIDDNEHFPYGIYHYSNEGVCSWYDFALEIVAIEGSKCTVLPITSDKFLTKAKRPPYSVMDKSKIKENFLLQIPHWKTSLTKMMAMRIE